VEQDVTRPTVAVPRLPDGADIADRPAAAVEPVDVAELCGGEKLPVAGRPLDEDPGEVGVAVEAPAREVLRDLSHLPLVVDVFREAVRVRGVRGRPGDERAGFFWGGGGKRPKNLIPPLADAGVLGRRVERPPRPENGTLTRRRIPFGVAQHALV